MAKKRKALKPLTAEQIAARKQEELRLTQANEVMDNLNISKVQHLGVSIWKNITIQLARGKNVAEVTYEMERDSLVGQSRTMEVKRLRAKEHRQRSKASEEKVETASFPTAVTPPVQGRPKSGKLRSKTTHLLKKRSPTHTVDAWAVARGKAGPNAPKKKLTFGAVLHQNPVAKPEAVSYSGSMEPLKGVNTPAATIKTYDLPLPKPKEATTSGKLAGIEKAMKMVPVASRREFAMFVHKHRDSGQTAEQLLAQFLAAAISAPAANDSAVAPAAVNETAAVELAEPEVIEVTAVEVATPEVVEFVVPVSLPLRDGRELKGGSAERLVRQRDAAVQAEFRAMVRTNFADRCAVSGKHLGGVLEAAHIEGADLGCYSVGNGILLSPTLHKLFDRHLMGINPETLTVHFKPGVEFEEYEGRVISPLIYNLDKARLAARWDEYQRGSK